MNIQQVSLFDCNADLYLQQLKDIASARSSICIELYRMNEDELGRKFMRLLSYKARKGLKVKLLVDAWGTQNSPRFFQSFVDAGGELRIFQKFRFSLGSLVENHHRNHRKLMIVDQRIVYIGSSNISAYSLSWRELNFRLLGDVADLFQSAFEESYSIYKRYDIGKVRYRKNMYFEKLTILQEAPSIYKQRLKKKYETLISSATREIIIETPYFLPGFKLRKSLIDAAKRGVRVRVISPYHSDVKAVDIVRKRYYGIFHESGVELLFYMAGNLHAKCLFIDGESFSVGSANFDYRSFRYQYEISLIGKEKRISALLKEHVAKTLSGCEKFDYEKWVRRSRVEKFFEWLLLPFRYFM